MMSVTFYQFLDSLNLSDIITVNAQVNGHNMQRIFDIVNRLPPLQFSLNKYPIIQSIYNPPYNIVDK